MFVKKSASERIDAILGPIKTMVTRLDTEIANIMAEEVDTRTKAREMLVQADNLATVASTAKEQRAKIASLIGNPAV